MFCDPVLTKRSLININFLNTLTLCNLQQYNDIHNSNQKILDLALSNTDVQVDTCLGFLTIDKHHPPLDIEINCKGKFNEKLIKEKMTLLNYQSGNYEEIIFKLSCVNCENTLNNNDVNDNVSTFYNVLFSIIKLFIPLKKHKNKKFLSQKTYSKI